MHRPVGLGGSRSRASPASGEPELSAAPAGFAANWLPGTPTGLRAPRPPLVTPLFPEGISLVRKLKGRGK